MNLLYTRQRKHLNHPFNSSRRILLHIATDPCCSSVASFTRAGVLSLAHGPGLAGELRGGHTELEEGGEGFGEATGISDRNRSLLWLLCGESSSDRALGLARSRSHSYSHSHSHSLLEESILVLGVDLGVLPEALVLDERHIGTANDLVSEPTPDRTAPPTEATLQLTAAS